MELVHHSPTEVWNDYTVESQAEESMNSVATIFYGFMHNKPVKKNKFSRHGKYFYMNFISELATCNYTFKEAIDILPIDAKWNIHSGIDAIRTLFSVDGPFVLVSDSPNSIDSNIKPEKARDVLSILLPACIQNNFPYPVFVQIYARDFASYLGVQYTDHKIIHFSSYLEPTALSYVTEVTSRFSSYLPKTVKSLYRSYYPYRSPKSSVIKPTFYLDLREDPVKYMYFSSSCNFEFDINAEKYAYPDVLASKDMLAFTYATQAPCRFTKLHFFVDLFSHSYNIQKSPKRVAAECQTNYSISEIFTDDPIGEKSILKAAPKNSLLLKLATFLTKSGEVSDIMFIWRLFVEEIQRHCTNRTLIPGVDNSPDYDNHLIYQKLEMINWCIEHSTKEAAQQITSRTLHDGSPMVIPPVQIVQVRTEDQVEETTELLTRLIDDRNDRIFVQSKGLDADAGAFKLMNPTANFEDFISWYSPRDMEGGQLSQRMSAEGNDWRHIWDTTEAKESSNVEEQMELAFDYLDNLESAEILGDLLPILIAAANFCILDDAPKGIPTVQNAINTLQADMKNYHETIENQGRKLTFEEYTNAAITIVGKIEECGQVVQLARSLLEKLPDCPMEVESLMRYGWCHIQGKAMESAKKAILMMREKGEIAEDEFFKDYRIKGEGIELFVSQRGSKYILATKTVL